MLTTQRIQLHLYYHMHCVIHCIHYLISISCNNKFYGSARNMQLPYLNQLLAFALVFSKLKAKNKVFISN